MEKNKNKNNSNNNLLHFLFLCSSILEHYSGIPLVNCLQRDNDNEAKVTYLHLWHSNSFSYLLGAPRRLRGLTKVTSHIR